MTFSNGLLEERLRAYLDSRNSFEDIARLAPGLATNRAGFAAREARSRIIREEGFKASNIRRYCFFAFDKRWAYVTGVPPVWNRSRPQLLHILPDAAGFLAVRPQRIAEPEGYPAYWSSCIGDDYALHKHAFYAPVVENLSGAPRANLSDAATLYLRSLGLAADPAAARQLWHHVLAVTYSPAYVGENSGGLRQGWPRVPLPDDADLLGASAALGAQLAALLDPDTPVPGVTEGEPRPELRPIGVPTTKPNAARDWRLTAGWGSRTDQGITMPGRGRTETRGYADMEADVAAWSATLGGRTHDVFLNGATFWRNVPGAVWECRIGGYQILKKWLSYRDHSIIGRPLTAEEVGHLQQTARRIAAILLLGADLDASYRACAAAHRPLAPAAAEPAPPS